MTPSKREEVISTYAGSYPGQPPPDLTRTFKEAKPIRILKEGEIFHRIPISDLEPNVQFHIDVALDEAGIIECKPIIPALHEMKQAVSKVVFSFFPGFAY